MKVEVEKYKQKKSVLEMGRQIRRFNKIKKVLGQRLSMHTQKAMKARDMLGQLDKGVQAMLNQFPKTPTIELDNQGEDV